MKTTHTETAENFLKIPDMDPSRTHRAWWKHPLLIVGFIALGAIVFFWFKNDRQNHISYHTQPVRKGDITLSVVATGNLEPTNKVDVGSELSGIIKTVEVDYNDTVIKGQVLARLDRTRLDAEVLQAGASLSAARANLLQAEATVKEARARLDRILQAEKLSNGKAVSQSDQDEARAVLDRAVADEASAKASILQSRATLDTILTDLSKTEIISPINGVVLSRSVEPGQTVAASFSAPVLFTLAEDLTQMALHVDVDEADVGRVKEGQSAGFSVDAYPDKQFQARVIQVRYGSSTTDGVVTYETVMKVDNKNRLLLPGMTATADITVEKISNTLLLPNAALRFSPPATEINKKQNSNKGFIGKLLPGPPSRSRQQTTPTDIKGRQKVWVLRNGIPEPVFISTGATNGTETRITGGEIKEGDLLVIESMVAVE